MEKMMIVKQVLGTRQVPMQDGTQKTCLELLLTDGIDTVVAEAWGQQQQELAQVSAGETISVWVQLNVQKSERDGRERYFNRARVVDSCRIYAQNQ